MSETNDPMIAALLREREGYERFGKKDRIKAVDEELKRRGYKADAPKARAPKARAPRQAKQVTADAPAKQTAAKKTPAKKTTSSKD